MIPARLALRNFLCYREPPPLEFAGIQAACLTGENGNGKSALLDAITWALWGKARGKSDSDLIALGAAEMEVEFEFFVGEARYRVTRKLRKTGSRGQTQPGLFFHVWTGEGWTNNTGSVKGETEKRVLDVLKLSYQTFINSAFLMQGRADEFTRATPADRKDVLAEILDLGRYDGYEARAKVRHNERREVVRSLSTRIDDDQRQLGKLPSLRSERDEFLASIAATVEQFDQAAAERDRLVALDAERGRIRDLADQTAREQERLRTEERQTRGKSEATLRLVAAADDVVARAADIEAGYRTLIEQRAALDRATLEQQTVRVRLSEAEQRLAARTRALSRERDATATRRERVRQLEALVNSADGVIARAERLTLLRSRESALAELERQEAPLREERQRLTQALGVAQAALQSELSAAERMMEETRSRALPVEHLRLDLAAAQREEQRLMRARADLDEADATVRDLIAEVEAVKAAMTLVRTRGEEAKAKRDELKRAAARGAAECPLCRSPLGADGLERTFASYNQEAHEHHQEFTRLKSRLSEFEASLQAAQERIRRLRGDIDRLPAVTGQVQRLLQASERAEQAAEQLVVMQADISFRRHQLETGDFATTERGRLAAVDADIAAIGYDRPAHQAIRAELGQLAGVEHERERVAHAQVQLAAERVAQTEADLRIANLGEEVAHEEGAMVALRAELERLPLPTLTAAVERFRPFEAQHRELEDARSKLPLYRANLAQEQERLTALQARMTELARQHAALSEQLTELHTVPDQLVRVNASLTELRTRREGLERGLGGVDAEIERLEELEVETGHRRGALERARREQGIYDELVRGFGKSGVQALIIESALPEIESAANELLARMTNNRMAVTLKTQKETLKGTVKETLEIEIADEWGTRNYEMYSGGEAFRINLALRIALSKLLARRAGAPLPTLVIDEGFGTQDAAGRERLVEALTAIRDDFQCLLLVTHIEELKDVFDVRIEVVKRDSGSVATVVAC